MAQYEIYRLSGGELVVDLQSDLLGLEATRIVAPLRAAAHYTALPGLTPQVRFEGALWLVRVPELRAVPQSALSGPVGGLRADEDALKRALDMLINGM